MTVTLFGTAFFAILFAELVGDKLLYGTSALAARFGAWTVLAGALPAFALKSLAAVILGGFIARLPAPVVALASCLAFALTAFAIWRGESGASAPVGTAELATRGFQIRGATAAFTGIFFAEWADPGQLATAALAARYHAPFAVWLAACAALTTKAALALSLGTVLHRYAPQRIVRWAGVSLGVVLAISAAIDIGR